MANLTITVDEMTLKRARIRAIEQGTSVNAVLARYLEIYAQKHLSQSQSLSNLGNILEQDQLAGGKERAHRRGKRSWRREELYDR